MIVVSPAELAQLVRDAVREALDGQRLDAGGDWLDAAGAAELLRVHVRTIGNLAKRRDLPSSRVGRLLRFKRSDVLAYLAARSAP